VDCLYDGVKAPSYCCTVCGMSFRWSKGPYLLLHSVWTVFPPFGTGLGIGLRRAGRRRTPPTATGSGRGRMDRSGSADGHVPRSSGAERTHVRADRAVSASSSLPLSLPPPPPSLPPSSPSLSPSLLPLTPSSLPPSLPPSLSPSLPPPSFRALLRRSASVGLRSGTNARARGSCHVRHRPLMGTADVNRCGFGADRVVTDLRLSSEDADSGAVSDGWEF
jgi:hypothetical protein